MDKLKCEVVQDLLILCEDDSCSQASKELVMDHIAECEQCKAIYKEMQREIPEVAVPQEIVQGGRLIKRIKKNIFVKNMLGVGAVIIALLLVVMILTANHTIELAKRDVLGIYELENGDIMVEVKLSRPFSQLDYYDSNITTIDYLEGTTDGAFFAFYYRIIDQWLYKNTPYNEAEEPTWLILFERSIIVNDRNDSQTEYNGIFYGKKKDKHHMTIWSDQNESEKATVEMEKLAKKMREEGTIAHLLEDFYLTGE